MKKKTYKKEIEGAMRLQRVARVKGAKGVKRETGLINKQSKG